MQVIKRNGQHENVSFDKITERITSLCADLDPVYVDPIRVTQETITNMKSGMKTEELDNLSAVICASRIPEHPHFNKLASRIVIDNLHKQTSDNFLHVVEEINKLELLSDEYCEFVRAYHVDIQSMFDYSRDFLLDFFGYKTLERSYLICNKTVTPRRIIERPQHMWMRVSIQIHGIKSDTPVPTRLSRIKETYDALSQQYFIHATPTLFNAGTKYPQMSSCFLLTMEDTIEDMMKIIGDIGKISKWAGGIGLNLSDIRANGTLIKTTNGKSDGIIPLCKTVESVARMITQGGHRAGSVACSLEPWHADIEDFLELKKNTGDENLRTRDLFLALWIPDLFMKRVKENGVWSLMCPHLCPRLTETYGDEFEQLYISYEQQGRYKKQISAVDLYKKILESRIESGMPYMSYKDNINRKSNQMNIGIIKCSNLCNEIVEVSNKQETAVCNLGSVCLPKFVTTTSYDFCELRKYVKILTRNLNRVIDINFYPIPETEYSNKKNRPIAVGIQGLADVFCMSNMPFDSIDAKILNKKIFEHILFAALEASNELAQVDGPYDTFAGSPASKGILQFHMWGLKKSDLSPDLDWDTLIANIIKHGLRNSLVTALMPTASTSQIMKNCECFEPYSSNVYVRTTLAGEFPVVNEHLVYKLLSLGLWTTDLYNELCYFNGSVQKIEEIPQHIRDVYKTAHELKQKVLIDQAIDRGAFIDQTQSLNLFQPVPDFSKLMSADFYMWESGLKGMYYLRTKPAVTAIKFGIDANIIKKIKEKYPNIDMSSESSVKETPEKKEEEKVCSLRKNNDEVCLRCQ
jgi:ribonucleoside-diphosphate reductase alpha subunit